MSSFPTPQCSDGFLGIHLPPLDTAFPSLDDFPDLFPSSLPHLEPDIPPVEPAYSNSGGLDKSTPEQEPVELAFSNSGLDNSTPEQEPIEPRPEGNLVIDERKRRRMISNRDSARRSRMRKQQHLENLRNQVNQLKVMNRELVSRLRLVTHQAQAVRTDNDRLRYESVMLHRRLWAVEQLMLARQLQNQIPPVTFGHPIIS